MVTLALGTLILMLLPKEQSHLKGKFRFNLFVTAFILSLFMLYNSLPTAIKDLQDVFTHSLKPFLFAILLYFPGNTLIDHYLRRRPDVHSWHNDLSRREIEVYDLLISYKTNKEISEELYIAESTVKKHVQNILKKANADNREALIKLQRQ